MWFAPRWPAPPVVRAAITTRQGGVSSGPWTSFNLGAHVGDDPDCVAVNRQRLSHALALPSSPRWLEQVHGTDVVELDAGTGEVPVADAAFTRSAGIPCVVMTADCLPVILCDGAATVVGVSHAGWRGLVAGVLECTVEAMAADPGRMLAYLGPAISREHFEVGGEVRAAFIEAARPDPDRDAVVACFSPAEAKDRYYADLYGLARLRLNNLGVRSVYGGGYCTFGDSDRFYSYRRDGVTGRMATLVWLEQ